jgi:hypothetical protein
VNHLRGAFFVAGAISATSLVSACMTVKGPELAWVRTDGRRIANDPMLLRQGKSDMASCNADLDIAAPTESAKRCMALKGYALVQKDQAEEVRAAYASQNAVAGK